MQISRTVPRSGLALQLLFSASERDAHRGELARVGEVCPIHYDYYDVAHDARGDSLGTLHYLWPCKGELQMHYSDTSHSKRRSPRRQRCHFSDIPNQFCAVNLFQ